MANPEHLEIVKQGVEVWNVWRRKHDSLEPDLRDAILTGTYLWRVEFGRTDLHGADLACADLTCAHLNRSNLALANLARANLGSAKIAGTDLSGADLSGADLSGADLGHSSLAGANLSGANLDGTKLKFADLSGADLSGADLSGANLHGANLTDANLKNVTLWGTDFGSAHLAGSDFTDVKSSYVTFMDNDLRGIKGLEAIRHIAPSNVGVETLNLSSGKIPEVFLRGCGFSDWQVESVKLYRPELSNEEIATILYRVHDLRAHQTIQISPLFISYSHADGNFVEAVEAHLNERGVRFWRDVHHSTAGRLESQIDRAIRLNPTVLLVLSEQSVKSDWVEHEARLARKLELETGRDVLCPVALDESWKTCHWPERLREQIMEYNVLDFSNWQDDAHMRRVFSRLIEGLGLFYK